MYDESFARRIDIAINKIGGEKVVNAKLNLSAPTLGRWKDGTSDPKMSNMVAFAQTAGVSLDWLLTGVGEPNLEYTANIPANDDEYDYVPAYSNVRASAGHGVFNDDIQPTTYLAFRKDWLNGRGLKVKDLVIIFTDGDSMSPTIPDGSTLVIDRSRNYPKDGKIYVIRIDDRLYVKRVQWILNGGLRLISDNKFYEPLDISRSELEQGNIEVIGQIIHTSHDYP